VALGRQLADAIKAELMNGGYAVSFLEYQRPVNDGEDEPDYSLVETDADAILDVSFVKVGYLSDAGSSDYLPWLLVKARLLARKDKSTLYTHQFSYGAKLSSDEGIAHFQSAQKYTYGDFDTLMAQSTEAAEGLRMGIPLIATRLAAELR
jgi:hypothetical protein